MTAGNRVLGQALDLAQFGWPVFPCLPGQKTPATQHGFRDASVDPDQIRRWFTRHPDRNLAVATGAPGPDVLDVDVRASGDGFLAYCTLTDAGLIDGAAAVIRTPSGGLHVYFAGSGQRSGRLPGCHVDFKAAGGYVLVPPSQIDGEPYRQTARLGGRSGLDWATVTKLLEPAPRQIRSAAAGTRPGIDGLAGWVARLGEGNRNAGLFWAACRALEAGPATSLDPLADAARRAGLGDREIRATLASARKTATLSEASRSHQAQAGS
jgi:Bifunctional DNA primase/polymerase, N-terminal